MLGYTSKYAFKKYLNFRLRPASLRTKLFNRKLQWRSENTNKNNGFHKSKIHFVTSECIILESRLRIHSESNGVVDGRCFWHEGALLWVDKRRTPRTSISQIWRPIDLAGAFRSPLKFRLWQFFLFDADLSQRKNYFSKSQFRYSTSAKIIWIDLISKSQERHVLVNETLRDSMGERKFYKA